MPLYLYNTLTRQKEEFVPINKNEVGVYTCGPTVYNFVHIGNLRTFLFEDILVRYLRYKGYRVKHIMNITDVDDKTIRNSQKENVSLKEFTDRYANAFFEDIKTLSISPASHYPRATDPLYISEMVLLVKKLLEKGYAYKSEGSVYFSIKKFKDYGKLAHLDMDGLSAGASGRVSSDEYDKENVSDFVLWKAYNENDGDVFWETELGKGRPGWHLECSAMSIKNLGETFDIHTGGIDNCFPHHENEIAQSESATDKKFVKYWMHSAFLNIDNEKMAKSAGNFFTLRDLIAQGLKPDAIRYALISAHYRMPLNFSNDLLNQSSSAIRRVKDFMSRMGKVKYDADENEELSKLVDRAFLDFEIAMDDDLNISQALAVLFEIIKTLIWQEKKSVQETQKT